MSNSKRAELCNMNCIYLWDMYALEYYLAVKRERKKEEGRKEGRKEGREGGRAGGRERKKEKEGRKEKGLPFAAVWMDL